MTDRAARGASLLTSSDLVYALYRVVPVSWLVRLARLQGRVLFYLRRSMARAVEANLAVALAHGGDPSRARDAARRFMEAQQVRTLFLHLTQRLGVEELKERFPIEGLEHLDDAIAEGRGAVLVLSHLNSLGGFVAVILLRRMGYDIRVAIPEDRDPWKPSAFRKFVYSVEGQEPESILESLGAFYCQFNIRPIMAALRENAVVAQTGDGWHSVGFVDVDFLGRRVPFTNGVMNIARRTGAMVIPMFVLGHPPDLRFVIEAPFQIRDEAELEERVTEYAARLEAHVVALPESWQHFAVPDTLGTMAGWRERSLEERYHI